MAWIPTVYRVAGRVLGSGRSLKGLDKRSGSPCNFVLRVLLREFVLFWGL